ncbi:MAG: hypothetical protein K8R36_16690 [Planctomycetales bacterium]|nr:hypothetical protein [Planctomycetales bacterium]
MDFFAHSGALTNTMMPGPLVRLRITLVVIVALMLLSAAFLYYSTRSVAACRIDLASEEVLFVSEVFEVDASSPLNEHLIHNRSVCLQSGSGAEAWFCADDTSVVYNRGRLSIVFVTLQEGSFDTAVEQAYRIYRILGEDTSRFREWEENCRDRGSRGAPFDQVVGRDRFGRIDGAVIYVRPGYSEKPTWRTFFRIDVRKELAVEEKVK